MTNTKTNDSRGVISVVSSQTKMVLMLWSRVIIRWSKVALAHHFSENSAQRTTKQTRCAACRIPVCVLDPRTFFRRRPQKMCGSKFAEGFFFGGGSVFAYGEKKKRLFTPQAIFFLVLFFVIFSTISWLFLCVFAFLGNQVQTSDVFLYPSRGGRFFFFRRHTSNYSTSTLPTWGGVWHRSLP